MKSVEEELYEPFEVVERHYSSYADYASDSEDELQNHLAEAVSGLSLDDTASDESFSPSPSPSGLVSAAASALAANRVTPLQQPNQDHDTEVAKLHARQERRKANKQIRKQKNIVNRLDAIVGGGVAVHTAWDNSHTSKHHSHARPLEVSLREIVDKPKRYGKVNRPKNNQIRGNGNGGGSVCTLEARQKALNTWGTAAGSSNSFSSQSKGNNKNGSYNYSNNGSSVTLKKSAEHIPVDSNNYEPSIVSSSTTQKSQIPAVVMKRGDWICSKCEFLNFRFRIDCFECGTGKEICFQTEVSGNEGGESGEGDVIIATNAVFPTSISTTTTSIAASHELSESRTETSTTASKPSKPNPQTSYFDVFIIANKKLAEFDETALTAVPSNTPMFQNLKPLDVDGDDFPSLSSSTTMTTTTVAKTFSYAKVTQDKDTVESNTMYIQTRHRAQPAVMAPAITMPDDEWSAANTGTNHAPTAKHSKRKGSVTYKKWIPAGGNQARNVEDGDVDVKKSYPVASTATTARTLSAASSSTTLTSTSTSYSGKTPFPALTTKHGSSKSKKEKFKKASTPSSPPPPPISTLPTTFSQATLLDESDNTTPTAPKDPDATTSTSATTTATKITTQEQEPELDCGGESKEWGLMVGDEEELAQDLWEGDDEEEEEEAIVMDESMYSDAYAMDDISPEARASPKTQRYWPRKKKDSRNGVGAGDDVGSVSQLEMDVAFGVMERDLVEAYDDDEEDNNDNVVQRVVDERFPGVPWDTKTILPSFTVAAVDVPDDEWGAAPVAVDPAPVPMFVRKPV
ncbi:UNVERIFIED_CONTAM: hypothetical protein HDU68_005075 [Siphonaria sp. JEL0065]|nr:hypothetical protein HDU68_005075 [Siphonaria sp. JEL0065]